MRMADTRTLEDRTRSADIRKWAEANGFEVAQRGNLPKGIIAAYEAANPGAVVDGAPDWDRASDDDLADAPDVLAAIEDEPDEPAGPPPPASLDEARERAGGTTRKRKAPGWARTDRDGAPAPPPPKVSRAVERDIEGKLALMLAVPVGAWELADPYCGGTMADAMPATIKAALPLICQSPGAVAFFTKGTTWMLWLGLANALRPVATAVYRHHLSPEAQREREAERIARANPGAEMAAQERVREQVDVSMYTTNVSGHVPAPQPRTA